MVANLSRPAASAKSETPLPVAPPPRGREGRGAEFDAMLPRPADRRERPAPRAERPETKERPAPSTAETAPRAEPSPRSRRVEREAADEAAPNAQPSRHACGDCGVEADGAVPAEADATALAGEVPATDAASGLAAPEAESSLTEVALEALAVDPETLAVQTQAPVATSPAEGPLPAVLDPETQTEAYLAFLAEAAGGGEAPVATALAATGAGTPVQATVDPAGDGIATVAGIVADGAATSSSAAIAARAAAAQPGAAETVEQVPSDVPAQEGEKPKVSVPQIALDRGKGEGLEGREPRLNEGANGRLEGLRKALGFDERPAERGDALTQAMQRAAPAETPRAPAPVELARPTPLQMLPIEIGMQAVRGITKFAIRLDPAELGRVDVALDIRDDGEVRTHVVVDRVETLNLLRRDASTLQQALEQAGLRHAQDGLQFSLRGEGQNRDGQGEGRGSGRGSEGDDALPADALPAEALRLRRAHIPHSSIDRII